MHDDALTDFDRDLERLLDVSPSPGFAAGVRRRVAQEAATRSVPPIWAARAAAAAAFAALVVLIVSSRGERRVPPEARLAARTVAPPIGGLAVGRAATLDDSSRTDNAARPRGPQSSAEPEVLVDQVEARAIRAVLDGIFAGRMALVPLDPAGAAPAADAEPGEIHITPLEVAPLTTEDGKEPDRR